MGGIAASSLAATLGVGDGFQIRPRSGLADLKSVPGLLVLSSEDHRANFSESQAVAVMDISTRQGVVAKLVQMGKRVGLCVGRKCTKTRISLEKIKQRSMNINLFSTWWRLRSVVKKSQF